MAWRVLAAQSPGAALESGRAVQCCVACLRSNPPWLAPRPFPLACSAPTDNDCFTKMRANKEKRGVGITDVGEFVPDFEKSLKCTASKADFDQMIQEVQVLGDERFPGSGYQQKSKLAPQSTKGEGNTTTLAGSSDASNGSDDDGLSAGAIAGIIVAVLAVCCVLVAFAARYRNGDEESGSSEPVF